MASISSHDRDKPPTKGVVAVNTSFAKVKRPVSFKLIWPPSASEEISGSLGIDNVMPNPVLGEGESNCSIWFPEAPDGYVALGCVVSPGRTRPPLSSAFCILASLVSPCALRDCITIGSGNMYVSFLFLPYFKFSIDCIVVCLTAIWNPPNQGITAHVTSLRVLRKQN